MAYSRDVRKRERGLPTLCSPAPAPPASFPEFSIRLHFIHLQLALGPSLNSIQGLLHGDWSILGVCSEGGGGVASAFPTGSPLSDQAEGAAPGLPSHGELTVV